MRENNLYTPAAGFDRPAEGLNKLIERWWIDHFPGSAVARDTAAWNAAHAAKEALKWLLARTQLSLRTVAEPDQEGR
jgi:hypothetical protein